MSLRDRKDSRKRKKGSSSNEKRNGDEAMGQGWKNALEGTRSPELWMESRCSMFNALGSKIISRTHKWIVPINISLNPFKEPPWSPPDPASPELLVNFDGAQRSDFASYISLCIPRPGLLLCRATQLIFVLDGVCFRVLNVGVGRYRTCSHQGTAAPAHSDPK